MSNIPDIVYFIVALMVFSLGVFLIVGTLRGMKALVDPNADETTFGFPYLILNRFGKKSIFYYHIALGIALILASIVLFILGIYK